MTLLYTALAYGVGVGLAWLLAGLLPVDCGFPAWLWLLPAVLLPLAPAVNRLRTEPDTSLRWGREFGFRTPRGVVTPALVAACTLALLMGALRYWGDPLYPCLGNEDLASYNLPAAESFNVAEGWRTVDGYIASHVAQSSARQRVTIAAQSLHTHTGVRPVAGNLTLLLDANSALRYGDRVRVAGVLSEPPVFAGFSWRDYLARHDIRSTMNLAQLTSLADAPQGNPLLRGIYALRSRGESVINAVLPEPHAALANGMLLGIDANIPDALMAQFNDTSTSHVIVISGSNIALIAGVLMALGARFGKTNRWVVGATLAAIALYALLVGAEASVVRAAIMGGLLIIATALGRRSTAIVSLAAAALVMALINPHILWDIGFQLSAVATLGLILLVPAFRPASAPVADARLPEDLASAINPLRAVGPFLLDTIAVSLAATLAVTPLLIWHFHRLSLVGILTNLLIVPVQPLILITGLAGLVVGLAGALPVASLFFAPTWLGLLWTVSLVQWTAELRWASIAVGGATAGVLMALCAAIGGLLYYPVARRNRPRRQAAPGSPVSEPPVSESPAPGPVSMSGWHRVATARLTIGFLLVVAALAWLGVAARPDGRTHLWLLPAERGQAVLVQSPTGRQALIDGGEDGARLLSALGGVLGLWDRRLDQLILTTDEARVLDAQATVANRLRVDAALTTLPLQDDVATWARRLQAEGIAVAQVADASWIEFGDGVRMLLHADGATRGVVELRFGDFRALFAPSSEVAVQRLAGESTLIVIGDDGRTAVQEAIGASDATFVVVYGDDAVTASGKVVYPNVSGALHLWTDGQQVWVAGR